MIDPYFQYFSSSEIIISLQFAPDLQQPLLLIITSHDHKYLYFID